MWKVQSKHRPMRAVGRTRRWLDFDRRYSTKAEAQEVTKGLRKNAGSTYEFRVIEA